jgi:hypothetical protein
VQRPESTPARPTALLADRRVEHLMQAWASHVGVDEDDALLGLGEAHGEVDRGRALALAGVRRGDDEGAAGGSPWTKLEGGADRPAALGHQGLRVEQGVEVAVASLGPQVADAEAGVGGQQRELAEDGEAEAGEGALEVEEAADAVVADVDGEGEEGAEDQAAHQGDGDQQGLRGEHRLARAGRAVEDLDVLGRRGWSSRSRCRGGRPGRRSRRRWSTRARAPGTRARGWVSSRARRFSLASESRSWCSVEDGGVGPGLERLEQLALLAGDALVDQVEAAAGLQEVGHLVAVLDGELLDLAFGARAARCACPRRCSRSLWGSRLALARLPCLVEARASS